MVYRYIWLDRQRVKKCVHFFVVALVSEDWCSRTDGLLVSEGQPVLFVSQHKVP